MSTVLANQCPKSSQQQPATRSSAERAPRRPVASDSSRLRARRVLERTIQYIYSRSFEGVCCIPLPISLHEGRMLAADEEATLFRWMNYLKCRAEELRSLLDVDQPCDALMDEIERLLDRSDEVRNGLARVFLKLAASIAGRFASSEYPFDELVSEANVTLLIAIEKFDADRGNRFSTYATHAIRRNLCRYLTGRRKQRQRFAGAGQLELVFDDRKWTRDFQLRMESIVKGMNRILDQLAPRDQFIIRSRFALGDEPRVQTLQSLAEQLGVSRERVRQLEQRALGKLRTLARQMNIAPLDA